MIPVRDNVLVRPLKGDEISTGGIIVPDAYKVASNKIEVIEVGRGTASNPMKFKKGDVGFRIKDSGTDVMIDGVLHFLVHQNYIIAKEN